MKKAVFILIISLITISWTYHKKVGGIYRYFWVKKENYSI
jgi:hypothetical protein